MSDPVARHSVHDIDEIDEAADTLPPDRPVNHLELILGELSDIKARLRDGDDRMERIESTIGGLAASHVQVSRSVGLICDETTTIATRLAGSPSNGLDGIRILLVDDDSSARRVRGYIEETGASVSLVRTIRDAKQALGERTYQIVVVDLGLPDGRGTLLLTWLEQHYPDVRALVVSGRFEADEDLSRWRVIPKPHNSARVVSAIRDLLRETPR